MLQKKRDLARAAAADGLREQVTKLVTRTRDSAVAAGGAAACDALDLLADVFGRADEAAGKLARIADERGIAGEQCQADYDALKIGKDKIVN